MKKIILTVLFALLALPIAGQAKEFVVRTPSTAEALAAAQAASSATGISPTILIGVFRQESGGGVNVGKTPGEWLSECSTRSKQETDCSTHAGVDCRMWECKDCHSNYDNAQHFEEIITALGYVKADVKTSFTCALGFMQVEPATWWPYRGGDPWNISDAMLVAAKYLKYLKDKKNTDDIGALAMYYCGETRSDNPECQDYAAGVVEKAGRSADAYGLSSFKKDVAVLTYINIGQQIKGVLGYLTDKKVVERANQLIDRVQNFDANYCQGEQCSYTYTRKFCKPCNKTKDCCTEWGNVAPIGEYEFGCTKSTACIRAHSGSDVYCCGKDDNSGEIQVLSQIAYPPDRFYCAIDLLSSCNPTNKKAVCPDPVKITAAIKTVQDEEKKLGELSADPKKIGQYELVLEKSVARMKKCMEDENEFILSCTDTFDWFEEGGVIPQELITRGDVPENLSQCKPGLDFYCMNAEGENETAEAMTFPIAPLKDMADKLDKLLQEAAQCKCENVQYTCSCSLPAEVTGLTTPRTTAQYNDYKSFACGKTKPIVPQTNPPTPQQACALAPNTENGCQANCKAKDLSSPFPSTEVRFDYTVALGFDDLKKIIASTTIPILRGYYTTLENSIESLGEAYGKEDEGRGIVYTCSDMRQVLKSYLETGDIKYCPGSGSFKCCPPIDSAGVKLVQEIKNCEPTDFFFCGDEIAITLMPIPGAPGLPGAEPPAPLPPILGSDPDKPISFAPGVEKQWQDASEPLKNLLLCIYNNFPGTPPEILAISDVNIDKRGGTDKCDYITWRTPAVPPNPKGDCHENSSSLHYGKSDCKPLKPDPGFSFSVDLSDTSKIDTIIGIINNTIGVKNNDGSIVPNTLTMKDEKNIEQKVKCRDLFSGPGGTKASVIGGNPKIEKRQDEAGDGHIHLWVPIATVAPNKDTRSYCYPIQK